MVARGVAGRGRKRVRAERIPTALKGKVTRTILTHRNTIEKLAAKSFARRERTPRVLGVKRSGKRVWQHASVLASREHEQMFRAKQYARKCRLAARAGIVPASHLTSAHPTAPAPAASVVGLVAPAAAATKKPSTAADVAGRLVLLLRTPTAAPPRAAAARLAALRLGRKNTAVFAWMAPGDEAALKTLEPFIRTAHPPEAEVLRLLQTRGTIARPPPHAPMPLSSNLPVEKRFGKQGLVCVGDLAAAMSGGPAAVAAEVCAWLAPLQLQTRKDPIAASAPPALRRALRRFRQGHTMADHVFSSLGAPPPVSRAAQRRVERRRVPLPEHDVGRHQPVL